jgi:hypothetical protein
MELSQKISKRRDAHELEWRYWYTPTRRFELGIAGYCDTEVMWIRICTDIQDNEFGFAQEC